MKVSNSSPKIKTFWIKGDLSKRVWFFFLQKNPFGSTVWSVWRVVAQPNKTVTFIAIDFTVHSERVIMMTHHKSDRINQSLKTEIHAQYMFIALYPRCNCIVSDAKWFSHWMNRLNQIAMQKYPFKMLFTFCLRFTAPAKMERDTAKRGSCQEYLAF